MERIGRSLEIAVFQFVSVLACHQLKIVVGVEHLCNSTWFEVATLWQVLQCGKRCGD